MFTPIGFRSIDPLSPPLPQILLLDEATSALDSITERKIQAGGGGGGQYRQYLRRLSEDGRRRCI